MVFDRLLHAGHKPWLPTPRAIDLDVWHAYDVPLIGTFRASGTTFLFASLDSADERVSTWAYTVLFDGKPSEKFASLSALRDYVEAAFQRGMVRYALADDLSLQQFSEPAGVASLIEGAIEFLEQIARASEAASPPRTVYDMKLAEVNVAADEERLVDA